MLGATWSLLWHGQTCVKVFDSGQQHDPAESADNGGLPTFDMPGGAHSGLDGPAGGCTRLTLGKSPACDMPGGAHSGMGMSRLEPAGSSGGGWVSTAGVGAGWGSGGGEDVAGLASCSGAAAGGMCTLRRA